jgi:hypothetical protein
MTDIVDMDEPTLDEALAHLDEVEAALDEIQYDPSDPEQHSELACGSLMEADIAVYAAALASGEHILAALGGAGLMLPGIAAEPDEEVRWEMMNSVLPRLLGAIRCIAGAHRTQSEKSDQHDDVG